MTFFSEVEYSRIRPQPVQVRLQVCSGSSCSTVANFSTPRSFVPEDVRRDFRGQRERKSHGRRSF